MIRVAYVARNDGTDTRVSKECNSLRKAGYAVAFIGWCSRSSTDVPDPMPQIPKYIYRPRLKLNRLGKIIALPGFVWHIAKTIRQIRPDIVHTVNEELGFLAFLMKRVHKFRSVCDVFDSIEHVWGRKVFPVGAAARGITWVAHRFSDALIVTDQTRKDALTVRREDVRVVGNYPPDVSLGPADIPPSDGIIRLYVAGTLTKERGLDTLVDLLKERTDIRVISAGWIYDEAARQFVGHPFVEYVGILTPEESLRMAARCHAIIALYEPSNKNRILASPNKIYDALCIGRPVVINREASISKWVSDIGAGYVVPYGDVRELSRAVDILRLNAPDIQVFSKRLRQVYERGYSWRVAERDLLAAYDRLRPPSKRRRAYVS